MPSLIESPLPAAGAWGSLYSAPEPVKPRQMLIPAPAPAKKPAAYGVRRNLETCTEPLGCETGAVDTTPAAGNGFDADVGAEAEYCAERKRRAREDEEEEAMARRQGRHGRAGRPLPPPLTTLARGGSRVRMVHERRDGRLEVYAVRTAGVLEAERSGGRLRMRLLGNAASMVCRQEPEAMAKEEEAKEAKVVEEEEAKEAKVVAEEEEEYGFATYVRGGRCVEPEDGAAAARRGNQWELDLPHYPCIF